MLRIFNRWQLYSLNQIRRDNTEQIRFNRIRRSLNSGVSPTSWRRNIMVMLLQRSLLATSETVIAVDYPFQRQRRAPSTPRSSPRRRKVKVMEVNNSVLFFHRPDTSNNMVTVWSCQQTRAIRVASVTLTLTSLVPSQPSMLPKKWT